MIVLLHPEADRWPVLSCLSPVSGSFFKSLNKNCDQQVDIDWISLLHHISMNQKQSNFAVFWLQ